MRTTAILVAAGPGTRLGAGGPKAFVSLGGEPLVIRTLRALTATPVVTAAVVVVPPDTEERVRALISTHAPWGPPITVVGGGAERQDSVRAGLGAVEDADLIAIHDAARPFISAAVIEDVVAAAARHGAAIVAVPATDTVKEVHPDGWIESTPDRQRTWLAQTPQVFRADLIREAHARAAGPAAAATDDSVLVERLGVRVYVVPGNPDNRKITTPEDLSWAEWWWAQSKAPG